MMHRADTNGDGKIDYKGEIAAAVFNVSCKTTSLIVDSLPENNKINNKTKYCVNELFCITVYFWEFFFKEFIVQILTDRNIIHNQYNSGMQVKCCICKLKKLSIDNSGADRNKNKKVSYDIDICMTYVQICIYLLIFLIYYRVYTDGAEQSACETGECVPSLSTYSISCQSDGQTESQADRKRGRQPYGWPN